MVILANSDVPESVSLARYYAEKRGIPRSNIVSLSLPTEEQIDIKTYVERIHNPLRKWLRENDWLNAVVESTPDSIGREQGRVLGHRMEFLVICKGVPLRVNHSDALASPEHVEAFKQELPPDLRAALTNNLNSFNSYIARTQSSVDSEIAALPANNGQLLGFLPNSLYRKMEPDALMKQGVIKTSRLEGPTFQDARNLIDGALVAEKFGLRGRAYVDTGGPYPLGNNWLDTVKTVFETALFPVDVHAESGTFPEDARFDAPALYFGWYAQDVTGPFKIKDFRFPPGAVAVHLHSFSATTLRTADHRWAGPLVARGAAATIGNVYEPTLALTHNLDILAMAIMSGWSFGDAAWASTPAVSWQNINIGDPLYRPMKVTIDDQLAKLSHRENSQYGQYIVLRRMTMLDKQGKEDQALQEGILAFHEAPGIALALELARRYQKKGESKKAITQLRFLGKLRNFAPGDLPLAVEAAELLAELGEFEGGLDILAKLRKADPSPALLTRITVLGLQWATRTGKRGLINEWQPPTVE